MTGTQTRKKLLRALAGESFAVPPFWLMRQAGRYLPEYRDVRARAGSFLELCYTPELAVEVALQPLRRFAMDGAILFSDILVVADALGQRVEFRENEGPVLDPIRSLGDVRRLDPDRLHRHLAPVYRTVGELSRRIPAETALIGFAGAPWTLAAYMVEGHGGTDFARARRWAYEDREAFAALITILVEATAGYLVEQVRNGAEAVQLFDSWAGALGESQFRRWVIGPTAKVVAAVKAACPGIAVIGFPRGCGALYRDYVEGTGVDAVSLDSSVPLDWAAADLQKRCTVQGNLDNLALLAGGSVLAEETERILSALAGGPFVFNLGHGVLPETPPENVARLAALIRGWRG